MCCTCETLATAGSWLHEKVSWYYSCCLGYLIRGSSMQMGEQQASIAWNLPISS